MIENNSIDEGYLVSLEATNNPFPTIDYRAYTEIKEGKIPQQEEALSSLYT